MEIPFLAQEQEHSRLITVIHLSDLHFGPPYLPHTGRALQDYLDQIDADAIVISGDLTENATVAEFTAASDFLRELPTHIPQVIIPGNHDVPQVPRRRNPFADPFRRYRKFIRPELDGEFAVPGLKIVGLNSTSWWGSWVNGWVPLSRLRWCREEFSESDATDFRILATHHSLISRGRVRGPVDRRKREAVRILDASDVDLVLAGHLHYTTTVGGTFSDGTSHGPGAIVYSHTGTATSRRGRSFETGKNTFSLIEIRSTTFTIHQLEYDEQMEAFTSGPAQTFRRRHGVDDLKPSAGETTNKTSSNSPRRKQITR